MVKFGSSNDWDDCNDDKWNQEDIRSQMCMILDWREKALLMSFNNEPFEKVKEVDVSKKYKLGAQIPWSDSSERRLQMVGSVCIDTNI